MSQEEDRKKALERVKECVDDVSRMRKQAERKGTTAVAFLYGFAALVSATLIAAKLGWLFNK